MIVAIVSTLSGVVNLALFAALVGDARTMRGDTVWFIGGYLALNLSCATYAVSAVLI